MRKLVLFWFIFTTSLPAFSASVWKAQKGGDVIFIGGTAHVLKSSDYPLPQAYDKAYQQAQVLVFETDIGSLQSPAFAQQMMAKMLYTDGRTFKDELSAESVAMIEAHLFSRQVPMAQLLRLKPAWLSLNLVLLEFQTIGLTSEGVDAYYHEKGVTDKKPIRWLESLEQQLSFLDGIGKGEEDELIAYTLDDIKDLESSVELLRKHWREGDMKGMANANLVEMQRDFPAIYQDMLVTRNQNWINQILEMAKTPEIEFVLVGALHLAGNDSVLAMLKQEGFNVTKVQ